MGTDRGATSRTGRARAEILSRPRCFRSTPRRGEVLAIEPRAFFFDYLFSGPEPTARTEDGIAIIHIRGPLEHHASWCWDSYESILCRVEEAMGGHDVVRAHERAHYDRWAREWDKGFEPISPCPARAIVLCFDSPGGEAAGATYAHRKLRSMREQYGVPLYAYANECAASAAYELACACDEVWLPDTGAVGSIGVIATLFDRTRQNKKDGLLVELVTSGEYKADGHMDRPLTSGIRNRMQAKVMELARIFWSVVAKARETTPEAIASLQAGMFTGQDAVDVGIADGVAQYDHFLRIVAGSLGDVVANDSTTPALAADVTNPKDRS